MSTNRYGLNVEYMKRNLELLLRDIDSYKPSEMERALTKLSIVAKVDHNIYLQHATKRTYEVYSSPDGVLFSDGVLCSTPEKLLVIYLDGTESRRKVWQSCSISVKYKVVGHIIKAIED